MLCRGFKDFMNIIYCHDNKLNNLLERSKESFLFHNPDAKFYEITEDKENLLKDFSEDNFIFDEIKN